MECFLLRPEPTAEKADTWWCLVKPGKKLPVGATFAHEPAFVGEVIAKGAEGSALIRFTTSLNESISAVANRLGEVPLPPYILRSASSEQNYLKL